MKLKNKLYLTIFTLTIFVWVMYANFQEHTQNDLEKKLTKNISINKLLLTATLEETYKVFEQKKKMITHIHRTALNEFKKDENISLYELKNRIRLLFNLQDLDKASKVNHEKFTGKKLLIHLHMFLKVDFEKKHSKSHAKKEVYS